MKHAPNLFPFGVDCPLCGEISTVWADPRAVNRWQEGELIQNAMPDLTPAEREVFISGICPDCQKKIFFI